MKKTYILKDQGKGTVTNLPIEKIVEISGSSSPNGGGGVTGDFIPLTGTEEGKPVIGSIEFTISDNIGDLPNLYARSEDYGSTSKIIFTEGIFSSLESDDGGRSTSQLSKRGLNIGGSSPNTNSPYLGVFAIQDYSDVEPENKLIYAQRSYVDSKISAASGNSYTTEEVATGGVYEFYNSGVDFDGTFPSSSAELVRKPIYRKTVIISGDDLANLNGAQLINYFPGMRVLCPFRDVIIAGTGVGYIRKVYYGMNNEFCSVQIDTDPMNRTTINFKDSSGAVKDITQCKMITITLEYTKEGSIVSPIF